MLKSKKHGDAAEDEIVNFFSTLGSRVKKNDDTSKRYDWDVEIDLSLSSRGPAMSLPDGKLTFEVKHDVMAQKTGNVAIEYHNSRKDKPSGIMVTKAQIWAHKIGDEIWLCTVEKLKNFVSSEKPVKMIESGGDKNANLFIYTIEHFTSICTPLSSITHINDVINMLP